LVSYVWKTSPLHTSTHPRPEDTTEHKRVAAWLTTDNKRKLRINKKPKQFNSIRCRIHTFQACSFSHSDTSPNFGLWFNVFSQHVVRCAVALERGVMYGIRWHGVNVNFHFLRLLAQGRITLTKKMPICIPLHQFIVASCKCSPFSASSSEP